MAILDELADKHGGLISDLRLNAKNRKAAMVDLFIMQIQGEGMQNVEYQEASSYLCGFAWKKGEANVENFEGVLAQMTVIGYLVETGCAYLMDEEGDYYQWACPKEAIWIGCSVSINPEMEKIIDTIHIRQCERMIENGKEGDKLESGV